MDNDASAGLYRTGAMELPQQQQPHGGGAPPPPPPRFSIPSSPQQFNAPMMMQWQQQQQQPPPNMPYDAQPDYYAQQQYAYYPHPPNPYQQHQHQQQPPPPLPLPPQQQQEHVSVQPSILPLLLLLLLAFLVTGQRCLQGFLCWIECAVESPIAKCKTLPEGRSSNTNWRERWQFSIANLSSLMKTTTCPPHSCFENITGFDYKFGYMGYFSCSFSSTSEFSAMLHTQAIPDRLCAQMNPPEVVHFATLLCMMFSRILGQRY